MTGKLKIHNPLRELYEEAELPQAIRRSLNFILIGNICGALCGIICGGGTTAMVGLATSMGADDLTFAFLTAIPQAAALLQIPFSMLVNRTHKRKKYMLTIGLFSRALWLLFGLIPFIIPRGTTVNYQLFTLLFLLGISSCCGAVINPCWFPWLSDLSPDRIRSRWLSVRDVIMSIINILAGLGIAFLLDHLPPETKYVIIFIIGGTVGMLDMISFAFCKEVFTAPPQKLKFGQVIGGILKNKPFMHLYCRDFHSAALGQGHVPFRIAECHAGVLYRSGRNAGFLPVFEPREYLADAAAQLFRCHVLVRREPLRKQHAAFNQRAGNAAVLYRGIFLCDGASWRHAGLSFSRRTAESAGCLTIIYRLAGPLQDALPDCDDAASFGSASLGSAYGAGPGCHPEGPDPGDPAYQENVKVSG